MNKKALKRFLLEANKAGYANASGSKNWVKEKDGSTTINFSLGDFRMHDNFFGGEPYGGREIVFYQEKPVWIMVYYGKVEDSVLDFEAVYKFLQKALLNPPKELPLRGPKLLKDGDFVYKNHTIGNLEKFEGEEKIFKGGKEIYKANCFGGLVDIRRE